MCDCRVCVQARRVEEIKAKVPPEDAAYLDSIMHDLEAAETGEVYWRMVHQGTWPGLASP